MVKVTYFQAGGKTVKVADPPENLPPPYEIFVAAASADEGFVFARLASAIRSEATCSTAVTFWLFPV